MCPTRVKRLTAFAACVDGNSVMACTAKQRTERRSWNVKSNAESRRKADEEEPRSSVRGKWRKRHGLVKMRMMRNESLKRNKRREKSVRREVSWERIGRDKSKAVGWKERDEKEIEEQRNMKREKRGRHVALPFLAGQVHASILAMPGGICLVQSRSEIATFHRTVPSSPFSSRPQIVLLLLATSDPSLACALATSSRRITQCRRLRESLRFLHHFSSTRKLYNISFDVFRGTDIDSRKNCDFPITAQFFILSFDIYLRSKIWLLKINSKLINSHNKKYTLRFIMYLWYIEYFQYSFQKVEIKHYLRFYEEIEVLKISRVQDA